jgi:hypothetical protein
MHLKTNLLFIATLIAIVFASCKKNDIDKLAQGEKRPNELRFFQVNANANPTILQINKSLSELNQENPFVSKFIKLAGYPKWDKGFFLPKRGLNLNTQNGITSTDSTFIIPVVSESDRVVTGAIIANIGDIPSYHLVLLKDYQSYNTDEATFVKAMMILNAKVYGYNKFRIEDTTAIAHTKEVFFSKGNTNTSSSRTSSVNDDPCDIIEIWYNPDGDACNCNGDEYYTGEWYYADEANCFSTTPQPILWYLTSEGGGYQLPNNYYTLPDLGGGNGGGGNPYDPIPFTEQQKTDYLIEQLNLDQTQQFYLINTQDAVNTLFNYLYGHFTPSRRDIAIWAVGYFSQHPDVNMPVFSNQFLGYGEGYDGDFDQAFWDNPNNNFPTQSLPSWADFQAAFPGHHNLNYDTPEKIYTAIGGDVYTNGYTGSGSNTCAVRLSKALNYSGVIIPNIPGKTFKGADNKYYFLGAANMIAWMKKTFGTSTNPDYSHYTTADGGTDGSNYSNLLSGKKGIYGLLPIKPGGCLDETGFCASGHVDLMNDAVCDGECYFSATGGVKEIFVWILH